MKYASEVIDLLGSNHHRGFRMMEIVNFIIGAESSRKEKERARKAVARVLDAMHASGSVGKADSPLGRGGYATYWLISADAAPSSGEDSRLGRISPQELKEIRGQAKERGLQDPYAAFAKHGRKAAERGIAFEMTFCEWWGIWKDRYHQRGGGPDALCMARKGDVGPYSVGNVYITTNRENVRDYGASEKRKRDMAAMKERRKEEIAQIIREIESLPPPQYTYEQVISMLRLGIPFELRPKKVGHEVAEVSSS